MPELPEVETVRRILRGQIINRKIKDVTVLWNNILINDKESFINNIIDETFRDIKRRGKWLVFVLDDYYLLSHLRMEGKYFLKKHDEEILKHEHVIFSLDNGMDLRYHDTRKFGKMNLVSKNEDIEDYINLGLEPFDKELTPAYLKSKWSKNNKEIKTALLDQTVIAGIGNIYADEILFASRISPLKKAKELDEKDLNNIIKYTREILNKAIDAGGTTIRSYTSSLGVTGRFQRELQVHTMERCPVCGSHIIKIKVGGRGTYYCERCQK